MAAMSIARSRVPNAFRYWNVFGEKGAPTGLVSSSPAFHFRPSVKWRILAIVFFVQISMNFNASVFPNAVSGISKDFDVAPSTVMLGQMIFLFTYALGCELWAPWSEEFGRKWVLQASLGFVNLWQLLGLCAPNVASVIIGRSLGGLSSAGGSVTLGIVADMWSPEDHQYAVNFVVLGSVLGGVMGPIVGGFIETYLHWRWNFAIQLILGIAAQGLQLTLPETEKVALLEREREWNPAGPSVRAAPPKKEKMTIRHVLSVWIRPFKMFMFEPIVLLLSLLSGFSDALIFTFLESFKPVFSQWGYGSIGIGLSFVPIAIGYFIAYLSFFYPIGRFRARIRAGALVQPEARLWWLMFTAPLLPIGLFGFAWASGGPNVVSMPLPAQAFACLVGIANFAIYMATVDYMVAAYGRYAASATGGNGMARDFLAGVSAIYAGPLFSSIGKPENQLRNASLVLAALSVVFVVPVYVFYFCGPWIRRHSPFATEIDEEIRLEEIRAGRLPISQVRNLKLVSVPSDLADQLDQYECRTNGYPPSDSTSIPNKIRADIFTRNRAWTTTTAVASGSDADISSGEMEKDRDEPDGLFGASEKRNSDCCDGLHKSRSETWSWSSLERLDGETDKIDRSLHLTRDEKADLKVEAEMEPRPDGTATDLSVSRSAWSMIEDAERAIRGRSISALGGGKRSTVDQVRKDQQL